MKLFQVILIALTISFINANVIDLRKSTYSKTINENEFTLVMYYLHFNKLCKQAFPKFKLMSKQFENIKFARLDGQKYRKFADTQGIDHFPSYEMFIWGVPIKYHNSQSVSGLRQWIKDITNYNIRTINSESEINQKDYQVFYVAEEDSQTAKIMKGLAIKYRDVSVHKITESLSKKLASKHNMKIDSQYNTIFAYRKHDGYHSIYKGEIEAHKIEIWMVDNEYPDYNLFDDKTIHWFENEKLPMMFYFFDSESANGSTLEIVKDAGAEIKGTALTVIGDIQRPEVRKFAETHGFYSYPVLSILDHTDIMVNRFYCRKKLKNLKKMHIYRCIENFRDGKLKPIMISEPKSVVKQNSIGAVTYQVGNTFGQLFKDFKKYHLVYFYDSKTQEGLNNFIQIVNKIGKTKNVSFNMFDMDKNQHEEVNHLDAGSLILLTPKVSRVPQLSSENGTLTEELLLGFLEDNVPVKIFQELLRKRDGENIDL